MKFRWINRTQRTLYFRYRMCSVFWGTAPGDGGYKNKITLGTERRLLGWGRAHGEWILTVAGLRLHYLGGGHGTLV